MIVNPPEANTSFFQESRGSTQKGQKRYGTSTSQQHGTSYQISLRYAVLADNGNSETSSRNVGVDEANSVNIKSSYEPGLPDAPIVGMKDFDLNVWSSLEKGFQYRFYVMTRLLKAICICIPVEKNLIVKVHIQETRKVNTPPILLVPTLMYPL
jgi:hypothetical protein